MGDIHSTMFLGSAPRLDELALYLTLQRLVSEIRCSVEAPDYGRPFLIAEAVVARFETRFEAWLRDNPMDIVAAGINAALLVSQHSDS